MIEIIPILVLEALSVSDFVVCLPEKGCSVLYIVIALIHNPFSALTNIYCAHIQSLNHTQNWSLKLVIQ